MKKPTLEEVKEYFKNAKTAEDWTGTKKTVTFEKLEITDLGDVIQDTFGENWLVLFHCKKGFAKILAYKNTEPKFEITKEQILTIEADGINYMKEWFPEVFKTKLEVGKWYKNATPFLFFCTGLNSKNQPLGYGFSESWRWLEDSSDEWDHEGIKEATEQEVFEALKNEAVKRGFKEDVFVEGLGNTQDGRFHYNEYINYLYCGSWAVFKNGVWATIIPNKTRKQAEQELNCKIID